VACLIFTMTARFGFGFLVSLGWYVVTVLGGLAIHMFIVYPLALKLFARVSPFEFFTRVRTVMLTAFSTSSSNATLPTALRVSELNLGVPRDIGAFVLTVGATANQNGTALYEGVTVLFLAQLAGVDLTLSQQLMVLYLAILGSIGTAGVPAGSIPFVVAVLVTVGINPALIAIIIGVDRLLDMCRTVLNVIGDMTAAVFVARSEGATLNFK
jgi:dicarboxylate/amino acid:cation (Na+ or H+) symporter, DAACS family